MSKVITAAQIRKLSDEAMGNMGDIFYDPDPQAGEHELPENICQNNIEAALVALVKENGFSVEGDIADLIESNGEG